MYSSFRFIFGDQVKTYIIRENVERIGEYAFYSCTSLLSITIPESVTNIGREAFYGCTNLSDIYCNATTPPNAKGYDGAGYNPAFDSSYINEHTTLHVPAGSLDAYGATYPWNQFKSIVAIE